MSIALYMDVHVHAAVNEQLELRGVDLITAIDDARADADDEELLDRATALGRVIFTQDRDFLVLAAAWQRRGRRFCVVVYGHQRRVSIGQIVQDLALIAKCYEPVDMESRVEHLPL